MSDLTLSTIRRKRASLEEQLNEMKLDIEIHNQLNPKSRFMSPYIKETFVPAYYDGKENRNTAEFMLWNRHKNEGVGYRCFGFGISGELEAFAYDAKDLINTQRIFNGYLLDKVGFSSPSGFLPSQLETVKERKFFSSENSMLFAGVGALSGVIDLLLIGYYGSIEAPINEITLGGLLVPWILTGTISYFGHKATDKKRISENSKQIEAENNLSREAYHAADVTSSTSEGVHGILDKLGINYLSKLKS